MISVRVAVITMVTGLFVTDLILSRIIRPHPGHFVSTTTTPVPAMNTAVLPPVNVGPSRADPPIT